MKGSCWDTTGCWDPCGSGAHSGCGVSPKVCVIAVIFGATAGVWGCPGTWGTQDLGTSQGAGLPLGPPGGTGSPRGVGPTWVLGLPRDLGVLAKCMALRGWGHRGVRVTPRDKARQRCCSWRPRVHGWHWDPSLRGDKGIPLRCPAAACRIPCLLIGWHQKAS